MSTDPITRRAHQILDQARAGLPVSPAKIFWALKRTGDIPRVSRGNA